MNTISNDTDTRVRRPIVRCHQVSCTYTLYNGETPLREYASKSSAKAALRRKTIQGTYDDLYVVAMTIYKAQ